MCFDPIMLCTCRLGGRGPRYSSHENNFVFSRRSTLLTLFTRIASCDHCTSFQYDKLQWLSLSSSRWQKERWGRFSQNSAANSALKIPTGLPPPPTHPHHQTKKSSWAFNTDFRFTLQPQIYCSHFSEFGPQLIGWVLFFFIAVAGWCNMCNYFIDSYPTLNFTAFAIQNLKSWPTQCLRRQLNQVLMRLSVGFMWAGRSQLECSRKIWPF